MGWMDKVRGKIGAAQSAKPGVAAVSPAARGGLAGQAGMPKPTATMTARPAFGSVMRRFGRR